MSGGFAQSPGLNLNPEPKQWRLAPPCEPYDAHVGNQTHGGPPQYRKHCKRHREEWPCEVRRLVDALADCVVKATERGVQDGEFVGYYWLPTGPIHRAIPLLQEHGITVRPGFDGRVAT